MSDVVIKKVAKAEIGHVRIFLNELGLSYDNDIEYTLGAYEEDKLVGTCSFSGSVIKCFGVDKKHMGEGIAVKLVTEISNIMFDLGKREILLFTLNTNRSIFEDLGFKEIVHTGSVTLFEGGFTNIRSYIKKMFVTSGLDNGSKAALVMNCNPFTLGHRYLIERAAQENDEVVVFVVEEDKSIFSFKDRFELIKSGTSDLKNVHIIPGGKYIISTSTFPSYFLKHMDERISAYTQTDANIFGKFIAPIFNIRSRYVGEEPIDIVTREYNKALLNILPGYGVEVKCIQRLSVMDNIISASMVRKLISKGELSELIHYVPQTTLEYLNSDKAINIIKKFKEGDGTIGK